MDLLNLGACFLAVLAISVIRTHLKKAWGIVELPLLIAASILSVLIILLMLYAAYVMCSRENFSVGAKVLYCLLDAGIIAVFLWLNIHSWKKWKDDCGNKE